MAKLLRFKNPKQKLSCAEAIQKLLDTAAEMFPKFRGQNSKTFWEAFDRIEKQGNYVVEMPQKIYHYGGTATGDAFASLDGQGPKGKVMLHPFHYNGRLTKGVAEQAELFYAFTALHETFHLAARGGYDDEAMAQVVAKITGDKPLPPGLEPLAYSNRWEFYLGDHCRPNYLSDIK